jgi:hypothetical protein
MRLPEEQRESGGWQGRVLAVCAIALAAVFACVASAQQPNTKQNAGAPPAATTKPATTGDAQAQEMEGLKRLIEQKMREQGLDPAATPQQPTNTRPQAGHAKPAVQTPQRAYLSKEAVPTSRPSQTRPAGKQPVSSCHGAPGQVDLTPPAPDQPQPHWTVEKDTIEAPPVWKGKQAKFVFHATNTGEGVLNIQLKGG